METNDRGLTLDPIESLTEDQIRSCTDFTHHGEGSRSPNDWMQVRLEEKLTQALDPAKTVAEFLQIIEDEIDNIPDFFGCSDDQRQNLEVLARDYASTLLRLRRNTGIFI